MPIQQRLLLDGVASTPRQAAAMLIGGRVYIQGQPARSGMMVRKDTPIEVKGLDERYVSKGGYKLEGALKAFQVDVQNRVCIDAGASTGGFTDCLLKHGAGLVYAVDVGYGQLMGSLRQNQRVHNLERTNIGDAALLKLDPRPTLGTVDLSYLSLRKAIPLFAAILGNAGDLICLVKPLFETDDMEARRTGQLTDDAYAPVLHSLVSFIHTLEQAAVRGVVHSPVTGNTGTREFFVHVALGAEQPAENLPQQVAHSVKQALLLPVWTAPDQ